MLLIAGGALDPNLQALANSASSMGVAWIDLRSPVAGSVPFHWDLTLPESELPWNGRGQPRGAFLRQDVFEAMSDSSPKVAQRALGWFVSVQAWLYANPQVRLFNRHIEGPAFNKPAVLLRAQAAGLRIPNTLVSNDVARLRSLLPNSAIAKPVAGGGYCQMLEDALEGISTPLSAMPAIVQPRLQAPEVRVFVVASECFAFEICSPSLDYRVLQDAEVRVVPVPEEAGPLMALMSELGMDFGAADFKTDPETGSLVFLELNTSPMFARFDHQCEGAIARAMVAHLVADNL